MHRYRITKYNHQHRNQYGFYTHDEWTSVSDVGGIYKNEKFTFEDYRQVESSYIKAVMNIMDFNKIDFLCVKHLEKNLVKHLNHPYISDSLRKMFCDVHEGQKLNKEEIKQVMQLALREFLWCKLESENMFVHFGFDYYMYIGTSKQLSMQVLQHIEQSSLYVEEFNSPYLD